MAKFVHHFRPAITAKKETTNIRFLSEKAQNKNKKNVKKQQENDRNRSGKV